MKMKTAFKLAPKQSRRLPTEYFVLANVRFEGQVVGYLSGRPILETATDGHGLRYRFVGVAPRNAAGGPDVQSLRKGEWIVQPGLVYASIEDAPESRAA